MNRAYALLTLKAVDEEQRLIEGIATTPSTDRVGDIVEPKGAKFALPIPFLWQHNSREPIGHVTKAKVTDEGILITAQLVKLDEPGEVKNLLDKAWTFIKTGLVRGLSIGFKPLESLDIQGTWNQRFMTWEWLELSAVTIAANQDATIQLIKSYADRERAATSGRRVVQVIRSITPPPAAGSQSTEDTVNTAERIAAFEATRAAKAARMGEIQEKAGTEGRTKTESEQEEFDTARDEIKSIDRELVDLRDLEKLNIQRAKPVNGTGEKKASDSRAGSRIEVVRTRETAVPGIRFARYAKCVGLAKGANPHAIQIAEARYGEDHDLIDLLKTKANVAAGTTSEATWAAPLVGDEGSIFADFVEWLRPQTILGRFGTGGIPGLRRVPFRVPLIGQTSGGAGYWVGEGKAKPLTKFDFERRTLEPLKVANIAVLTEEVLRDSSPSADMIVRDQLAAALRERMDRDFIDPAKAASAGVSPASITNGVTPIASSGDDADAIRADVKAAFAAFIAANNPPTQGVWIMSATSALTLSLMTNPLGEPEFGAITMQGGTFAGLPVITSEFLADDDYGALVVLVNASDIYLADEGGVAVDVSREASLEMDDAPSSNSDTPTESTLVSLWQTNSVGFRAERTINWLKRRTSAVQIINEVAWGTPAA